MKTLCYNNITVLVGSGETPTHLFDDGPSVKPSVVLPCIAIGSFRTLRQIPHGALRVAFLTQLGFFGYGELFPFVGREVNKLGRSRAPMVDVGRHNSDDEVVVGLEHAHSDHEEKHPPLEWPVVPKDVRKLHLVLFDHSDS